MKKSDIPFVGLHAHSVAGSFFDGLGFPGEHMDSAFENGMDALALTDHGNMNGLSYQVSHAKKMMEEGGLMHGFQIWVNLPAKDKMMNPRYQDITADQSPTIEKDGVWARVIAGECLGIESSIDTVIPITYVHVKMESGATLDKTLDTELNGMVYVFKGEVSIEGKSVKDGSLALLSAGSVVTIEAKKSSEFLILAGPELNEPIARYGPFVMNTREEILQAIDDYQRGILA